ncbi:hypothetical protein DPSP01_004778 [Paraphaeosphaeria sporulosa]
MLALFLDGNLSFQLTRKGFAGSKPRLMIQMHDTSSAATIIIPGYQPSMKGFSLAFALQGGLLDLFDAGSNSKIPVPSNNAQPGELVVRAGAPSQWFNLRFDPCEDLWAQLLSPGHEYEIRWADGDRAPRAYRGEAGQGPPEQVPVRFLPRPIKLNVFDEATAPPQFSLSLTPTNKICHLSGEPRFGFKLEFTSHINEVITVCLYKTPLRELHGLEDVAIVEDEGGEEVEWPWGIGCWEGPEPFPSDDNFEELKPGVPYKTTFWLDKFDTRTSTGGELESLQARTRYTGMVSDDLRSGFGNWRRGNKEKLLAGDVKENEERWKSGSGCSAQSIIEVSDPFTFETAA